MKSKRVGIGAGLVLALIVFLALPNAQSLYEGLFFYLPDVVAYQPLAVRPVDPAGRYAALHDLVRLRNRGRRDLILASLQAAGVTVVQIPIPDSDQTDLFVRFAATVPITTLYSAHYDKLIDDPRYEGASDNTAAVSVLLASVQDLARRGYHGSAAFLFTGEEETGLRGAIAFVEYARMHGITVRENVNFDNVGRGRLAIRPSVPVPGFVVTVPYYGDVTYDGRQARPSQPSAPANERVTRALLQVQPDLVVYRRFTASSDSNVFQAAGIDTVAISSADMYSLEQTWHTYTDRLDLLDERNLDRMFDLVTRVAGD